MDPAHPLFETSEGAAGDGASYEGIVAGAEPAEAAPVEAPVEAEAPAEAPAPEGPPEWFQQYLQRTEPLLNQLQVALQPEPEQQAEVDLSQLDMSNPEHVSWLVQYQNEKFWSERMSPYEPILGMTAEEQGRQVAEKFFDQMEVGTFDRDQALVAYSALMAENPGANPEQVLRHAAELTAKYEDRIRQQGVDEYKKTLDSLETLRPQPPLGTSPAQQVEEIPTGEDKYERIARNWEERQRAGLT